MSIQYPPNLPINKKELFERLRLVMQTGWCDMPSEYGGTGGPGMFLENLLGKHSDNQSFSDTTGWEVKSYTEKTHLITLFHKEARPEKIMRHMVSKYGWKDKGDRLSFRHTISGKSDRFKVVDDANQIFVRPLVKNGGVPYWTHDDLLNAAAKLRKVILVKVERNKQKVRFTQAECFEDFALGLFIYELVRGTIAIDFDVREAKPNSTGLRNHGTKFRVPPRNMCRLYAKKEPFK
jgi:hypothetical protein